MQFDIFEVKLRYCFNQLFSSRQEKDIGGGGTSWFILKSELRII